MQTCRRELLDCTLDWNQRHLLHALHEYETHYNRYRATKRQGRPRHYVQYPPMTAERHLTDLDIRRHNRLGGIVHEYRHAA